MITLIPFIHHPLSLGIILFIQIINISLLITFFTFNRWYSFIIFLIIISGLLVLFTYITTLASNEKFNFNANLIFKVSLIPPFIILISTKFNFINPLNLITIHQEYFYPQKFNNLIRKFLDYPINLFLFLIIWFLFFSIISTVKITDFKKGPLRPLN